MKVPITIFVIAFILTILATFFISLGDFRNNKNYILLVNNEEISHINIARSFDQGMNQYRQTFQGNVNEEEIKVLLFDEFLNNTLLAQSARDLGIRVSSREVNDQFKAFRSQFQNRDAYARFLQFQGFTQNSLKDEIRKALLIERVVDNINNSVQVSEASIRDYFEKNKYGKYLGGNLNELREEIKESLLSNKSRQAYNYFLENLRENAHLEWMEDEQARYYQNYQSKVVYEISDYKFTNVDLFSRKIMLERIKLMYGLDDLEVSMEDIKEDINKEVRKAIKAKELGIVPRENLSKLDEIFYLGERLKDTLIANKEISQEEIKEYFEKNRKNYDKEEVANINIIELEVELSENSKAEKYKKAQQILGRLKDGDNFAQLAMRYSDCPSSSQGGNLGWFSRGQMVEEFEKAVFSGEIGLYPEVVETQFGYHIIRIEDKKDDDVNASHILIQLNLSPADVKDKEVEARELVEEIKKGNISFDELAKEKSIFPRSSIDNITRVSHPQQIGLSHNVIEEIFAYENNILQVKVDKDRVFIIERTFYKPYEEADLDTVLNRVKYDIAREKAIIKIEEISMEI